MWSALTKDFNELAANFRKDSRGFVDMIGQIAQEVVGDGGVYAGDEASADAREMPLDSATLLAFQENEETYTRPLSTAEKGLFTLWSGSSPFSSAHVHQRVGATIVTAAATAADEANSPDEQESSKGNATPQAQWSDEPADETRQRLLDYSEVVLAKYMALVGDHVSPRASPQGSPIRMSTAASVAALADQLTPSGEATAQSAAAPTHTTPAKPEHDRCGRDGSQEEPQGSPFVATPLAKPTAFDAALAATASPMRLTEDVFFDRYFFRLAQLRAGCAEQRVANAKGAETAEAAEAALTTPARAPSEATSASPATGTDKKVEASMTDDGTNDDEDAVDIQVPAFARKIMAAANNFVTNIDSALMGGSGDRDGSDEDENVTPPNGASSSPIKPRSLADATVTIGSLEAVVVELQEALRVERGRVRQLTEVLETNHIAVPTYPATSCADSSSPAGMVGASAYGTATTTTATPTASTAATPAANQAPQLVATPVAVGTSPATKAVDSVQPTPSHPLQQPPSPPQQERQLPEPVLRGTEEDDDAWERIDDQ